MDSNGIGNTIRDLRNSKRMTQKELADALSVAASTISHWEKGRRQPSISELTRITEFFNVSLNVFGYHYDLDDHNAFQTEQINSTQIIRVYTPGFHIRCGYACLYVIGLIFSLYSIRFSSSWSDGILLIGALILLVPLIDLSLRLIQTIWKPTRSYATPATTTVYFEHRKDREDIDLFRYRLMTVATVMVFSSILLQSSISLLLIDLTDPMQSLFIVLYGLMVIIVTYLRRLALSKSPVLYKLVNYHRSPHRLSHGILYLNWSFDVVTFLLLIILIAHLGQNTVMVIRLVTSIIAMLHAVASYFIIRAYNTFIMGFQMYTVGANNEINRIL